MKHRHEWINFKGSGFAHATELLVCTGCSLRRTKLVDVETGNTKVIDGNYMEDPYAPVFIIAEFRDNFKTMYDYVKDRLPETTMCYWIRETQDIDKMKKQKWPRYILGLDWDETAIIHHPDMRRLFATGHW